MRVFMLGWEFPPFISGGLGTACYGLTKAMSGIGTDIMFVLPRPVSTPFSTHVRLVSPRPGSPLAGPQAEFRLDEFDHVTFRTVNAALTNPYNTPASYAKERQARLEAAAAGMPVDPETMIASPEPAVAPPPPRDAASTATPGFLGGGTHYAGDLFAEVQRYAALAAEI